MTKNKVRQFLLSIYSFSNNLISKITLSQDMHKPIQMSFLSIFIFVKHHRITREKMWNKTSPDLLLCFFKIIHRPYNRIQCFKQKISPNKRELLEIQIVTHNITAVVSNNQSKLNHQKQKQR